MPRLRLLTLACVPLSYATASSKITLLHHDSHTTLTCVSCAHLALRSSGLSIIDLQVHLSVLAPDAADVVDLSLPEVEGPNTDIDNIDVFSCPMMNKKTI